MNKSNLNLRWTDAALISVAASFSVLELMAKNLVGLTHPERLIALMLVAWALGVAVAALMVRFGTRRAVAVIVVFIFVVVFSSGAILLHRFGPIRGWAVAGIFLVLIGLVVSRIDNDGFLMTVTFVLAVFLAFVP